MDEKIYIVEILVFIYFEDCFESEVVCFVLVENILEIL